MRTSSAVRRIGLSGLAVCLLCVCLAGACSKEQDLPTAGEDAAPATVAQVADGSITVEHFRSYLAERTSSGADGSARALVERRLQEAILEELLYQEALRLELDRDPVVRRRTRQILVRALLDEQINREPWEREVSEEEIRAYYEAHAREFQRPEEVRVADLFVAVNAEAGDEEKAAARSKAESLLAEALGTRETRNGFGRLIEAHSDRPADYQRGDTGFFDAAGSPSGIDPAIARAAFELSRNGDIHEEVIAAGDGYHVIMRIGKRSAVEVPLERVRARIEQRIRREDQERTRKDYFARLEEGAEVRVDDEAVAAMARELEEQRKSLRAGTAGPTRDGGRDEGPPRFSLDR